MSGSIYLSEDLSAQEARGGKRCRNMRNSLQTRRNVLMEKVWSVSLALAYSYSSSCLLPGATLAAVFAPAAAAELDDSAMAVA